MAMAPIESLLNPMKSLLNPIESEAMPGTSTLTFHQGAGRAARRARHLGGEAQPRQRHLQALGDQAEGLGPDLRGVTQNPWQKWWISIWDFGKKWWISRGSFMGSFMRYGKNMGSIEL